MRHPTRRAMLAGAAAALGGFGSPLSAQTRMNEIDRLANGFLDRFAAPGLSVAYSRHGNVTYTGAFGFADPERKTAMRTAHRMRIASISKPITAAAIMTLMDAGRLRPDSLVFGPGGILNSYVEIVPDMPEAEWIEAITIDHLLTHTAGGWVNDGNDPTFRHKNVDHRTLIERTLREAPLLYTPGAAFNYSNFGYCILGRVIEALTGQSYAGYVTKALLEPASIFSLEIAGDTRAERKEEEVAYEQRDNGDPYDMPLSRMDSHGGWIGTASDLVRLTHYFDGFPGVPDLVSAEAVQLMASPGPGGPGYGRGWSLNPDHGNWWHNGALPGTASLLVRVDNDTCFAGLTNTRVTGGDNIHDALDQVLWQIYGVVMG